ncbi:hypothetical protein [Hymenobacter glacieicola]|uniref:Helix-turn-helix domain-containing protein n=1 Tax=Hymenobacter glacieicola TaxID=1562124 RepID=A0ABQ1X5R5_9BACT|nr:hypothetical protein [Hymenobacter glacieicola]GGG60829.1 hypothetical protein GCM10011378_41080 [Hymenobacter glacieicola]
MQVVQPDRLKTPAQHAKDENVTRQTVYNWIRTKMVKSHVIGGRIFVEAA